MKEKEERRRKENGRIMLYPVFNGEILLSEEDIL
jgi:hypothetical protein